MHGQQNVKKNLMFYCYLHLVFPSCRFPSGVSTYNLYFSPQYVHHSLPILPISPIFIYEPNNIGWGVIVMKIFLMLFSPFSCYFLPPSCSQFSLSAPYSRTPSTCVLLQCEKPSIRAINNNRTKNLFLLPSMHWELLSWLHGCQDVNLTSPFMWSHISLHLCVFVACSYSRAISE